MWGLRGDFGHRTVVVYPRWVLLYLYLSSRMKCLCIVTAKTVKLLSHLIHLRHLSIWTIDITVAEYSQMECPMSQSFPLVWRMFDEFAFHCLAALSELLFPALSCIAVGGIMLLVTNLQVNAHRMDPIGNILYFLNETNNKTSNCPILYLHFWWTVFLFVVKVGNLFAAHRSTIITLYNGAFDSSAVVFLIIKVNGCSHIIGATIMLLAASSEVIHCMGGCVRHAHCRMVVCSSFWPWDTVKVQHEVLIIHTGEFKVAQIVNHISKHVFDVLFQTT